MPTHKKQKNKTACTIKEWKCPNQFCNKIFKSQSGLTRHYLNKAKGCYKANENIMENVNLEEYPGIEPDDIVDNTNYFFQDDDVFPFYQLFRSQIIPNKFSLL